MFHLVFLIAWWNYLRMRGEYAGGPVQHYFSWELPPHARRILTIIPAVNDFIGTTSACAENTYDPYRNGKPQWNYLRMRGEYSAVCLYEGPSVELPPHARRIPSGLIWLYTTFGTTSACAENTDWGAAGTPLPRNYLRMRGEYSMSCDQAFIDEELPPHARRIRL